MGRKPHRNQWTDELVTALLQCRRIAQLQKENGNAKGIITLVHEEWNKDHAKLKMSKAALKTKLSTLHALSNNEQLPTQLKNETQANAADVADQTTACNQDKYTDSRGEPVSTEAANDRNIETQPVVNEFTPPTQTATIAEDVTTIVIPKRRNNVLKPKRKIWSKNMQSRLVACHNIARRKATTKRSDHGNSKRLQRRLCC